jgi:AraC-like DNA-binding protein
MNTTTHIDFLSVFIFIGVFQGIILSYFFIKKSTSNIKANKYQGLLLLSLALLLSEQFLNLTGYIVKVLPITNYSEPLNFTLGPLLYLFVKERVNESGHKKNWIHFVVFFLYLGYMSLDFMQSNDFKYNTYVNSFHPDWQLLNAPMIFLNDPLQIKSYVNAATALQMTVYILLALLQVLKKVKQTGKTIFNTDDEILESSRNMIFHIIIVVVMFILVKLSFKSDTGDYLVGFYVSVFILITTFRVMNDSAYFDRSASFMDISFSKYSKSSLTEVDKIRILENITLEFANKQYFSNNLASLSDLAKRIGVSSHHVSQVINEKLNQSFFELLASYRVEEAKRMLADKNKNNLNVEEISEIVGYNSKAAFNNAFKRLTDKTPSEYRKTVNNI